MSLCFMFYVFTELIKTCLKVRTCICWVPEYKSQCKLALQSCCQSSHCNCTTFLWNSSKTVMTMKPLPSNSAWMCDLVTQEEREGGAEAKEKQSQKEKMFLPGGCSWQRVFLTGGVCVHGLFLLRKYSYQRVSGVSAGRVFLPGVFLLGVCVFFLGVYSCYGRYTTG